MLCSARKDGFGGEGVGRAALYLALASARCNLVKKRKFALGGLCIGKNIVITQFINNMN